MQRQTPSHLKCSLFKTIQVLLEHSGISKQTLPLEGDTKKKAHTLAKSVFNLQELLGPFLRYLHLIMICFLNEEVKQAGYYPTGTQAAGPQETYFDRQTYIEIIKVLRAVIQHTPYHLMHPGLASVTLASLVHNLKSLERLNNRDQLIRNEIFCAIT